MTTLPLNFERIVKRDPEGFAATWFARLLDPTTRVAAQLIGRRLADQGFFHQGNCYLVHYAVVHPRVEELLPLVLQVEPNTDRIYEDCTPIMLARDNLTTVKLLLKSGSENRVVIRSFKTDNGKISGASLVDCAGVWTFYQQPNNDQLSIEHIVKPEHRPLVSRWVTKFGLPTSRVSASHFCECVTKGYYRAVKRFLENDPNLLQEAVGLLTYLIQYQLTRTLTTILETGKVSVGDHLINLAIQHASYSCLTTLLKYSDDVTIDWSQITDLTAAQVLFAAGLRPVPDQSLQAGLATLLARQLFLDGLRAAPWTSMTRAKRGVPLTNLELTEQRSQSHQNYSTTLFSDNNSVSITVNSEIRRSYNKLSPDATVAFVIFSELRRWHATGEEVDQFRDIQVNALPISSWSLPNHYYGPRATRNQIAATKEHVRIYLSEFDNYGSAITDRNYRATEYIIVRLPLTQSNFQFYLIQDRTEFLRGAILATRDYHKSHKHWIAG